MGKEDEKRILRLEFDDASLINIFKACCAARGESMKQVIEMLIKDYVGENMPEIIQNLDK